MEIPPNGSRQPPDGHEFPDFIETLSKTTKPKECISSNSIWSHSGNSKQLDRTVSSSNCDLSGNMKDLDGNKIDRVDKSNLLHSRSQSLVDVRVCSRDKNSKWSDLVEQRKSRLSKLKGLVIPETAESDVTPSVNIPEIISCTAPDIDLAFKVESDNYYQFAKVAPTPVVAPIVLPSWNSNTSLPKYSPAFKRKSLQVYPVSSAKNNDSETSFEDYINKSNKNAPTRTTNDPKSLESIGSPTSSDCSFDYSSIKAISNNAQDYGDSDKDSAVSSSQSSFVSRSSTPPSITQFNGQNKNPDVQAFNRRSVLASAKCCSGKDERIGSPEIPTVNDEEPDSPEVNEDTIVPKERPALNRLDSKPAVKEEVPVEPSIELPKNNVVLRKAEIIEAKPTPIKRTSLPNVVPRTVPVIPEKVKTHDLPPPRSMEKRNTPLNVQSIRANFEKASASSVPIFPKGYSSSPSTNNKPIPPRKYSREISTRRKTSDSGLLRQTSLEERKPLEPRRFSSDAVSSTTVKDEVSKITKAVLRQEQATSNGSLENGVAESRVLPPSSVLKTVVLKIDQPGTSLGITLAGGVDYENKNITIHRIRYGSVAYQDGQLLKGDKVISIDGQNTSSLTHAAATELLKVQKTSFTLVVETSKDYVPPPLHSRIPSVSSLTSETKGKEVAAPVSEKKPTHSIKLMKDKAGLGFSIEGGRDSPNGDVPLVIRKIFAGGAADKCGELKVGDEILSINKVNFQTMTRIEAWNQMKKTPEGEVLIEIVR